MLESEFEQKVAKFVKNQNGLCLKWVSPGVAGVPDRICLFPGGKIIFLELKRPGRSDGRSSRQRVFLDKLVHLGFPAYKVSSMLEVAAIIDEVLYDRK